MGGLKKREIEGLASIRNAGTIVSGILAITINSATNRDSPLKTGFKILVEKYMTVRQSGSRSLQHGVSQREVI